MGISHAQAKFNISYSAAKFNLSHSQSKFNISLGTLYIPHAGGIGYWRIGTEFEVK